MLMQVLRVFFLVTFISCGVQSIAEQNKTNLQAPLFNNLGSSHYPISTKSPLAQQFFDQGMVLYYGFEWGESIRSFKETTRLDPNCGMCYWGLALALRAKINAPVTGYEYQDAKNAIQKALALSSQESPINKAYIKALALRFQHPPLINKRKSGFSCHVSDNQSDAILQKEMSEYLHAMKKITEQYPKDNQAKVLYAVSLFWSLPISPKSNNPSVSRGIQLLKTVLAQDKFNVGANHYYIHFVEPYSHPEQAMESADRLNTLVPGSEHLVHMPAHIYFLTGRYQEATQANLHAIDVFQQYNKQCREQGFEPEVNFLYLHNYDFLRTTAMMQGRKQLALGAAQHLIDPPFSAWLAKDPQLEWFMPIPYYVKVRFGMWQAILHESIPAVNYQYARGMLHYARGLAFSHTNQIKRAKAEAMKLKDIIRGWHLKNRFGTQGLKLLSIAHEILKAKLADAQNNEMATFSHLTSAMKIQDAMGYHEPPDWYFPVRQAVADAYLKWGHPEDAIFVYQQDLKQYPLNGWSLSGLSKALRMLGKNQEAEEMEKKYQEAWKNADSSIIVK